MWRRTHQRTSGAHSMQSLFIHHHSRVVSSRLCCADFGVQQQEHNILTALNECLCDVVVRRSIIFVGLSAANTCFVARADGVLLFTSTSTQHMWLSLRIGR